MKKNIILSILLSTLFISESFAQGLAVGLKGGLNFASQEVDLGAGTSTGSKTGYHFGAYGRVNIIAGFGAQVEGYYSIQGSEFSNLEYQTDYLQIPVLARKSFLKLFNVHLGPQFGVLLKNEVDFGAGFQDVKDNSKTTEFSIAVGAGVDLPFGLNGTLRYVHGLSDVADTGSEELKNRMFQVSIGYDLLSLGND